MSVTDAAGVQALFREMASAALSASLEGEPEEELGYSKYGYRNKDAGNICYTAIVCKRFDLEYMGIF